MPKIADTAELRISGGRRWLYIDGEELPWYSSGISYERGPDDPVGYVTVRILVERYWETHLDGEPDAPSGDPAPTGHSVPAGSLRRADVLGDEARMPGEPLGFEPGGPVVPEPGASRSCCKAGAVAFPSACPWHSPQGEEGP